MTSRLIPKQPGAVKFIDMKKSAGILDDYAVRKNVATKEGTIEAIPTENNHIANKLYVDSQISGENHWDAGGTVENPTIYPHVDGVKVGIGTTSPSQKLDVNGNILTETGKYYSVSSSNYLTADQSSGTKWDIALGGYVLGSMSRVSTSGLSIAPKQYSTVGTAARYPSFTFNGDTNTGMFSYGADILGFTTGGTTRAIIDASGNIGIGTTSPGTTLEINGTTSDPLGILKLRGSADNAGITLWSKASGAAVASRNWQIVNNYNAYGNLDFMRSTSNSGNPQIAVMSFDLNGNVGIGTKSPDSLLHINSSTNAIFTLQSTQAANSELNITASANNIDYKTIGINDVMSFSTYYGEKMRITPEGNVGIGTTAPNAKLDVRGTTSQSEVLQTYSGTKTLTDGSATGFVEIAVATGEMIGGNIDYAIYVSDGTDFQSHMGGIGFAAVNKVGTVTSSCQETYLPASAVTVATSGTLTDSATCTNGTAKITLNMDANTSLSGATLTLKYTVKLYSMNTITGL